MFLTFKINICGRRKWLLFHLGFEVFLPSIQFTNHTPKPNLGLHFVFEITHELSFQIFFPFTSAQRNVHQCQLKVIIQHRTEMDNKYLQKLLVKYIKITNKTVRIILSTRWHGPHILLHIQSNFSDMDEDQTLPVFLLMYKFQ